MIGIGIVGLPNVGKSTLFNAITRTQKAEAANYPFATIEPNIGAVSVPDERLKGLEKIVNPKKIVPATVEFIDIAGLVKGASKGEGLGNQFLSNIRNTAAICQVVRCFDDDNIIHVEGAVDPIRDIETINLELILSDLEVVERAILKNQKLAKNNKDAAELIEALEKCKGCLENSELLTILEFTDKEYELIKTYQFLTLKPMMFVVNISEDDLLSPSKGEDNKYVMQVKDFVSKYKSEVIIFSAKIESELAELDDEERAEFMADIQMESSSLEKMIISGYRLLGLITYFTAGVQEVRAWTINKGVTAPVAASEIHTDIQKGFIRAEVASYDNFINDKGWQGLKEKGNMRVEGKEYIVEDGDIMYFRFNV